eukprot:TRINITY_DN42201_c0_g1_i1.p1 TRINITY_DN42201_c0_g1~~TRINITY_DN42201_c0_g1_i1.p1  ORF type:complete len:101 (+),score=5.89 TRINITY_DN42201_c0_g1_i1:33-305(+)
MDMRYYYLQATHFLEGDGFLSPFAYDTIRALMEELPSHPTLTAICRNLHPHPDDPTDFIEYGRSCVRPVFEYIRHRFTNDVTLTESSIQC